jgi:hypothetical protein
MKLVTFRISGRVLRLKATMYNQAVSSSRCQQPSRLTGGHNTVHPGNGVHPTGWDHLYSCPTFDLTLLTAQA